MPDIVVFGSSDLTLNADLGRSGLAWQLVRHGVSCVVASMIDLDDDAIETVMPALHRLLAVGVEPLQALQRLRFDDVRLQVAADSLLCIFE